MSQWIEKALGEVTSYIAKGITPKYSDNLTENTVYVLNQKCNRNYIISYEPARIHDLIKKKISKEKLLKKGDVLINSTGQGTAGRVAQIWDIPYPTATDGHMITLRASQEIDKLYYGYAIKAHQNQIESLAEGSTGQTEINRKRLLEEVVIRFPKEKDVQYKIAHILENIDKKIAINKKINRNLSEQVMAIFIDLFGDADKNATVDEVSLNVTDGVHNTVKDDPDGEFFLLSCKNIKGGSLSLGDAERRINQETFEKLRKRTKLEKGDILLSSVGTIGELLLMSFDPDKYEFQRSVAIIKPNIDVVSSEYLYCALLAQKQEIIRAAHGAVQQCIFISDIKGFTIHKPTAERLIQFDNAVVPMMKMIYQNEEENRRLSSFRGILLPKLMSGELDVSELNI